MNTPMYPPSMDTTPYASPNYSGLTLEGDATGGPCYRCGKYESQLYSGAVVRRKGLIPVCIPCFIEARVIT